MEQQSSKPYIEITEQPCSRGLRFRYECEGRSAGSVSGVNSTQFHKTSPSIRVRNYTGPLFVVVSLVSKDRPYRPHPFNLVGKAKEIVNGICFFSVPPNHEVICFPNFGIQCVKRREIFKSLAERQRMNVDPFKTGFCRAKSAAIDTTSVRLCFQVFLEGQVKGNFNVALDPVVSQPIYDKKSSSELSIRWYSQHSATVAGDTVMCILCEKVSKDDIQVRFFCEETGWESTALFTAPICHKQIAVIIKTPRYVHQNTEKAVPVKIELRRPSDGETSEPVSFMFLPLDGNDPDGLKNKRRKLNETPRMTLERLLAAQAQKQEQPSEELLRTQFSILKAEPWGQSSKNLLAANGISAPFECPTMNSCDTNQMNSSSNMVPTSSGCPAMNNCNTNQMNPAPLGCQSMNNCNTNQMNPASNTIPTSFQCPTMNTCNPNQMSQTSHTTSTSMGCPIINNGNPNQMNPAVNMNPTSMRCPSMNSYNANQMNPAANTIPTSFQYPAMNHCNTNQMNPAANTIATSFQCPTMNKYNANQMNPAENTMPTLYECQNVKIYNANQMNPAANAISTSYQCPTMKHCNDNQMNQMNQMNCCMNPAANNTMMGNNISNNQFYYNNLQPMQCTTTSMNNQKIEQLIDISTPNHLPAQEQVLSPLHSFDFAQSLPDITQDTFLQFLDT